MRFYSNNRISLFRTEGLVFVNKGVDCREVTQRENPDREPVFIEGVGLEWDP